MMTTRDLPPQVASSSPTFRLGGPARSWVLFAAFMCALPVPGHALVISGQHEWSAAQASFSDRFGTGSGSNPSIGLEFAVDGGKVTHDYNLGYLINPGTPTKVLPGQTVTLMPWLQNQSAGLTTSQNVAYKTNFDFDFEIRFAPDIHISVSNVPSIGPLNANGNTPLNATSNTYTTHGDLYGYGEVRTAGEIDAWSASGDLLNLTGFPTPGINLEVGLGIDIGRVDRLQLRSFSFTGVDPIVVPEGTADGNFTFSDAARILYELRFITDFYYVGSLDLALNGTLVPDVKIVEFENQEWRVARMEEILEFTQDVTIEGSLDVDSTPCSYCTELEQIVRPDYPVQAWKQSPFASSAPVLDVEVVPEPNTLALLAAPSLAALWLRRRRGCDGVTPSGPEAIA